MSHLQDRVVVVTGAGSGFGRLLVRGSVARGARAVALDVDGAGAASTVADLGDRAIAVRADVTDAAAMRAAVARTIEAFGAVDVMVNNAGIMPLAFWADHGRALDAWSRCIDVNIKGVMHGIAAVYDHMTERGRGHVVNISSIYGNHAVVGSAVYTATKAAVNILSDTLRQEAQGRIKVTVVRPTGVMGTGLGDGVVNQEAIVGITGQNTLRFGERVQRLVSGEGLRPEETDVDDVRYWAITPHDLVRQIVWAIDQPWGVTINDITVRATGEDYVL